MLLRLVKRGKREAHRVRRFLSNALERCGIAAPPSGDGERELPIPERAFLERCHWRYLPDLSSKPRLGKITGAIGSYPAPRAWIEEDCGISDG